VKVLALPAVLLAGAASAQTISIKPLVDLRLRYENVDQGGLSKHADALTFRMRPTVAATFGDWSALAEGEATDALIGHYNSGTNGKDLYPLVVDPENFELNRAQIRYANPHGAAVTAGRQLLELADQRFVGSSNFRQNQQTYDAARVQLGEVTGPFADLTYAWSDRTVNGIHGEGPRQQAVSGNNFFALAGYGSPTATVTAFAYLVDQDEFAVQQYRLSSQTYGVRLAGSIPLHGVGKLGFAASAARQSGYHRNPNNYVADYWQGEANILTGHGTLGLGYEVLGADKGLALTSVQTPLASLFKFNGWADKFTTTPPNGLRDLYASAGCGWSQVWLASKLDILTTFHRFRSDRLDQDYGDEWDFLASAKIRRTILSLRYADYHARDFATNTRKLWLEADWTL